MTDTTKTVDVHVRMSPAEAAVLDAVRKRPGHPEVSRSEGVRWALRELAEKLDVVG